MLQYILLRLCCIFLGAVSINHTVLAKEAANAATKISAEEAFLQGQQYLEQANTPLAELSLTRIPSTSPYAKLLAGNIAIQKSEFDRAFLLLLPLQSNQSLNKSAAASLHANLSLAYEKQGDIINALDQLMRREPHLKDTTSINGNHDRIWQLLSSLSLQDLIALRGESADTNTQGWIDLCLATKNQDMVSSIKAWANSYPDHIASDLSKKLMTQNNINQENSAYALPSNGSIALMLPPAIDPLSPKVNAFYAGLQAALNKYALSNTIKTYSSQDNKESFAEQVNLAKSEGATYFMMPLFDQPLNALREDSASDKGTIAWLESSTEINNNQNSALHATLQDIDLSLNDEAKTIAAFAINNAMQHITIVTTDDETAMLKVKSFLTVWENARGENARIITLAEHIKSGDSNLLDLKAKIAEQTNDMLLLATSAADASTIKPYLDISTPILGFSNINELNNDGTSNIALNAVRFVDIPFLLNTQDAEFTAPTQQDPNIISSEFLRYYALGVDYLKLLLARAQAANREVIVNGLTGKLTIDKTGKIQRQLSIARFTYDGITQE